MASSFRLFCLLVTPISPHNPSREIWSLLVEIAPLQAGGFYLFYNLTTMQWANISLFRILVKVIFDKIYNLNKKNI